MTREDLERVVTDNCRSEVLKFALLMEEQLVENDHKGGWSGCRIQSLWPRVYEELDELASELNPFREPGSHDRRAIGAEAADVANFLMMITDLSGALES